MARQPTVSLKQTPLKGILSNNMAPLLLLGDKVFLKTPSFSKINVNDIASIMKNGKYLTHRVIYKTNKYLITKGDNSLNSDGKIYAKQILGKVYSVKRDGQIFDPEDIYLFQSTIYFQEITKLKNVLETNNVNYVFLKGLPIHLYYFNRHPRRIYADCDLLIAEKDRDIAHKLLIGLCFEPNGMEKFKNIVKFFDRTPKEIEYIKLVNDQPIVFDIHLRISLAGNIITLPNKISAKEEKKVTKKLLHSRTIVDVRGIKLPLLEPNIQIFYLLLHFSKHKWHGIQSLQLIAELVTKLKQDIDWSKIILLAERCGVLNFLIPSIYLLQKYFHPVTDNNIKAVLKERSFSLKVYRLLYPETSIFDDEDIHIDRLKKGITTFLFLNENFLIKVLRFLHPSFLAHFLFLSFRLVFSPSRQKKRAVPSWRDYYRL